MYNNLFKLGIFLINVFAIFFVVKFNILYSSYYLFLFFIIVGFTYFVLQFRVNSINPISSRLSLSDETRYRWCLCVGVCMRILLLK